MYMYIIMLAVLANYTVKYCMAQNFAVENIDKSGLGKF